MKRWLIVLLLVISMTLVMAGTASANGGPHGDYTATTDSCAGCHRAHTATGQNLLVANSTYSLCMSCHGSSGTGANTNVEDGLYLSSRDDSLANQDVGAANTPDNAPLLGGGFVNYRGAAVTSTHDPTGTTNQAWGAGGVRGQLGTIDDNMDCASCHDPHGSGNYRIIKETINGVSISVSQVDEGSAKDYDTPHWPANMSNVCGACHDPYQHATNDTSSYTHAVDVTYSGSTSYTDANGTSVSVPLAANNTLVCSTCHLAHGTSASMEGYAANSDLPTGGDSALLREDNRGVCQACHQK